MGPLVGLFWIAEKDSLLATDDPVHLGPGLELCPGGLLRQRQLPGPELADGLRPAKDLLRGVDSQPAVQRSNPAGQNRLEVIFLYILRSALFLFLLDVHALDGVTPCCMLAFGMAPQISVYQSGSHHRKPVGPKTERPENIEDWVTRSIVQIPVSASSFQLTLFAVVDWFYNGKDVRTTWQIVHWW